MWRQYFPLDASRAPKSFSVKSPHWLKAPSSDVQSSRSNNPYAGNQFISNLGQLYGPARKGDHRMMGRLIFRAWAENQGRAQAAVVQAIQNTIAAFNQGRYDKAA